MTKPTDKDATIKLLQEKNQLLQKRIDRLLEDNENLVLDLQAIAQKQQDDARRKSWGGNGRY
jgi:hypothetical protein